MRHTLGGLILTLTDLPQITCETVPALAGAYTVVVKVNNQATASTCCYNYTSAATPSKSCTPGRP
jgi:hypothetical protein